MVVARIVTITTVGGAVLAKLFEVKTVLPPPATATELAVSGATSVTVWICVCVCTSVIVVTGTSGETLDDDPALALFISLKPPW